MLDFLFRTETPAERAIKHYRKIIRDTLRMMGRPGVKFREVRFNDKIIAFLEEWKAVGNDGPFDESDVIEQLQVSMARRVNWDSRSRALVVYWGEENDNPV